MKLLALVVLLALMQANPPAQKAPDPSCVCAPIPQAGKDWWYRANVIFTGALVFIGGAGVIYAIKTLKAIKRQAKANEDQLTEIQQSSEKTDRMILLLAQQTENGKIATEAAKMSADAALLNAQAVINAERPWVMIHIKEDDILQSVSDGIFDRRSFQFTIVNHGKSPAHVISCKGPKIEVCVDPGKDLSIPPDYGIWDWERKFLAPRDSLPFGETIYPAKRRIEAVSEAAVKGEQAKKEGNPVAYGLVEYTDGVSDVVYKTAFCYRHERMPLSSMGGHFILCGPRVYNEYT